MGAQQSKEDGLTAASIERLYAARAAAAQAKAEHSRSMPSPEKDNQKARDTDDDGANGDNDEAAEEDDRTTSDSSSTPRDTPLKTERPERPNASLASRATADAIRNAAGTWTPIKVAVAGIHLADAIRAFGQTASCAFDKAIEALREIGVIDVAKAATKWMKAHPWETAAIIVPLILLACTPALLGIAGFTAGGIVAGSIAAGVHAGIGSVAAGSTFAILTSAAMGGYGVPIVFGGIWAISTAVMGGIAAWKRSRGGGDDDGFTVMKIDPSGGDGDSGGAVAVSRHNSEDVSLKPDQVLFHGGRI